MHTVGFPSTVKLGYCSHLRIFLYATVPFISNSTNVIILEYNDRFLVLTLNQTLHVGGTFVIQQWPEDDDYRFEDLKDSNISQ